MEIIEFLNEDHIKNTVTNPNNKNKLFVIDCGAVWCGPCKSFAKFYHDFVKNYPKTDSVVFCTIDVDVVPDFCDVNNISSVPTILFIKNADVIDRMLGADVNKFKTILNNCLQPKQNQVSSKTN